MQSLRRGRAGEGQLQDDRYVAQVCGRDGMGCGEQYAAFEPSLIRKYSMKLGCYGLYIWPLLTVFDFYQNLNQFYGVLAECCTATSCPSMAAGPGSAFTRTLVLITI